MFCSVWNKNDKSVGIYYKYFYGANLYYSVAGQSQMDWTPLAST